MNEQVGHRPGTILLQGLAILRPSASPGTAAALTPARLADLMLAAPLARRAGLVLLEPDGDLSTLSILRGTLTVAELRVVADVGNAMARGSRCSPGSTRWRSRTRSTGTATWGARRSRSAPTSPRS